MQLAPISPRKTANCIANSPTDPSPTGDAATLPMKTALSQAPSAGNVLERNDFAALGQRNAQFQSLGPVEPIQTILDYAKKTRELKQLLEQSRAIKDLSQRSQSLQNTAKTYLATIHALEHLRDVAAIKEELSADLASLLEEDLLPLYCMGYLAAGWFQDYTPFLENILNLKSLDAVTGRCLKQYYDIQTGSYQWCKAAKDSFEFRLEAMVQAQIHFLIASLEGASASIASKLSLVDTSFRDLIDNYPEKLGFHSIAAVYVFLIRQESSSAIVNFLDTYELIYGILQQDKLKANFFVSEMYLLKSSLALCTGWRRFFSLHATHILKIAELSSKYSMRSNSLTASYLENLKLFQISCKDCYGVIKTEIQQKGLQFLSQETFMADLVSCLSIALQTVKNWTEDTFVKIKPVNPSADLGIEAAARDLKAFIIQQSSALLEAIAEVYLRSERLEHQQAAQAIRGFLERNRE